jgi:ligand-binding SRPBCC domain-containing protein
MKMRLFEHQFEVAAPVKQVAMFHQDARTLRLLTPPPVLVQLHMVQPLKEGSVADFTMWLGPIPVRWVAVHRDVDPERGFTDAMMRGPFEAWVHQHRFEVLDANRTRVIDSIQALPGAHPFWGLVSKIMWNNLPLLFRYRRWQTRRVLQKHRDG